MNTERMSWIKSSEVRKAFAKAAEFPDLINLSIGQPDVGVPEEIKKSMIDAIQDDKTRYTQSAGLASLKEKVLNKYKNAEDVIITSGAFGGIVLSFSVLLDYDDELLVLDPYFLAYPDLCGFLGAKPKIVECNDDFSVNFDNLENAVGDKTKAIIINTPGNPTGHVIGKEEMGKLVEFAKKHDLWIISDEVYEDYDYDGKFVSAAEFDYKKIVVLSGFSKNFSMLGLRIGYAVGSKEFIDQMTTLQQYTFVCAPSISQHGVDDNFDLDISKRIETFKHRRDFVYDKMKDHFEVVKPSGAFYFFVKLPNGITSKEFCGKAIEHGVLVVPGFPFSKKDDHFRMACTVDVKVLDEGIKKLIETLEDMKNGIN